MDTQRRREIGKQIAVNLKAKYGEDHFKTIGHKGGKAVSGVGSKGFGAMAKSRHQAVSSKGGSAYRQPKDE